MKRFISLIWPDKMPCPDGFAMMLRSMCMAAGVVRSALGAVMFASAAVTSAQGVGIDRFPSGEDGDRHPDALIFYPARAPQATTSFGLYDVLGLPDAVPRPGRFPLILISHGAGGDMLSHHRLASHLALNGFIVAALTHEGENSRDHLVLEKASRMHSRAQQVSMLLTAVLGSAHGARVDQQRVGIVGYSTGSMTAMAIGGALPDSDRLRSYCAGRPAGARMCEAEGIDSDDIPHAPPSGDARVKAALLLAPDGIVFTRGALEAVQIPVGIIAATADEAPMLSNLRPFYRHLRGLALLEVVPGAGHDAFLAACGGERTPALREPCRRRPFIDRERIHAMVSELATSFFWYAFNRQPDVPRTDRY